MGVANRFLPRHHPEGRRRNQAKSDVDRELHTLIVERMVALKRP